MSNQSSLDHMPLPIFSKPLHTSIFLDRKKGGDSYAFHVSFLCLVINSNQFTVIADETKCSIGDGTAYWDDDDTKRRYWEHLGMGDYVMMMITMDKEQT